MAKKFQLLDQYGNPVDTSRLQEEQAGPSLTGVRQIITDQVTSGLTPARLAAILRQAEVGDPHLYLGLAEELEEKDLHYQSIMGTRKRQVCQLEVTVEPASDDKNDVANADLIRDYFKKDEIEDELFDILDAVGKGFSVCEINWDFSEGQWQPYEIVYRDPRWFEFDRDTGRKVLLKNGAAPEPLDPCKFIVHYHKAKSGLPIRGGIARGAAWMWMFKNFSVKDWVIFAEVYGQPLRVGKYHNTATDEEKATLLRAVRNIGTDAAAIIPDNMLVEFIDNAKTGSTDLYKELCNWMDLQMSKAVLGQTTTTDAVSGGHAVSKEHNEVREDIERADAKQLCTTLNRDLVKPIVNLNRGPQKVYPKIKLGRGEYEDREKLANSSQKFYDMGIALSQSEIRKKAGLSEPVDDDDALVKPAPAQPVDNEPGQMATQSSQPQPHVHAPDDIETAAGIIAREELGLLDGAVAPLVDLLNDEDQVEQIRDRLLMTIEDMDTEKLTEFLARVFFITRAAARVGASEQDVLEALGIDQ